MKIKNLGATLFVMTLALTAHAQLEVKSTGKVEIGTNPNTSNLFVEGNASISNTLSVQRVNAYNVTTYLFTQTSDNRVKRNISNLSNSAVERLKQVECKTYFFKSQQELTSFYLKNNADTTNIKNIDPERLQYGFIAQDLENIFPELVYTDTTGIKSVDYVSMIPIMLQAIQDLQTTIQNQELQIKKILAQDNSNNSKPQTLKLANVTNENEVAILYQNKPNPFCKSTTIDMKVPVDAISVMLYIYDLQGTQIKSIQVDGRGTTSVTINGSELQAAMYIYSLVVDGQLIGSKQMMLTE